MPTTITNSTLTAIISEAITLNGQQINSENKLIISDVNEIDKRILTVPSSSEITVISFSDSNSAGAFIRSAMKYFRIANKDSTNFLRLRLKRLASNSISTLGSITAGSNYPNGTYTPVSFTGGTGSGGTATIVVLGSGIYAVGSITGGSGYVNGTYTAVPLTGGAGSGAQATIVVSGTSVTSVTITTRGTGYVVGNSLSASNTNLGGSGSGFSVPVASLAGGVTSVTLLNAGRNYTIGDTLSASNGDLGGNGSGFSIPITAVVTVGDIADIKIDAGKWFFIGNAKLDVNTNGAAFGSFDDLDSINAQADTAPIDVEYFVANT